MEVTPRQAAEFLKRKAAEKEGQLDTRFEKAKRDFDRIVAMIIETYHPQRIYQWGSLLRRDHFSEISDIDIALEGLPPSTDFFSLLSRAEGLTGFPLDIVELEHIDPLHRESIVRKGKLVYESKE